MENHGTRVRSVAGVIFLIGSLSCDRISLAADTTKAPGRSSLNSSKLQAVKRQKSDVVKKPRKQQDNKTKAAGVAAAAQSPNSDDVASLREQLALQQKQIEQLRATVEKLIERTAQTQGNGQAASIPSAQTPNLSQVASLAPVVPAAAKTSGMGALALSPIPDPGKAPVTQEQMEGFSKRVDQLSKTVEGVTSNLAGFKFSGDLRFRFDGQLRSGNSVAGPLQNVRERYRLRFNVNKALTDRLDFHLQVGSGTFNNPLTLDTDFAGTINRGPIFITEYYAGYHDSHLELRGGKMEEVFADNSRFLFDDDVRFNGFHQIVKFPFSKNSLGITRFELRAGEYILTNPNVVILPSSAQCSSSNPPANCAFVSAGFSPGGKVRDTQLFHPGFAVYGNLKEGWTHQFIADLQWYRNPTEIQLASTAGGFPLLVNGYFGTGLAGPVGQVGNATTTPGGAIYTARNFQVARVNYRIVHTGWKTSRQGLPVWLDLQAARNVGTSFERNAYMATLNVGEVKKFGDVRFMYIYGVKQANSMISQLTDDDLGTGTGVNLRTHLIRIDLGLTKFFQWQNLLFIQDELSPNDPARRFFVPLQRGAGTTYRIHSQFQFTF